jgi:hypothetical protein
MSGICFTAKDVKDIDQTNAVMRDFHDSIRQFKIAAAFVSGLAPNSSPVASGMSARAR